MQLAQAGDVGVGALGVVEEIVHLGQSDLAGELSTADLLDVLIDRLITYDLDRLTSLSAMPRL